MMSPITRAVLTLTSLKKDSCRGMRICSVSCRSRSPTKRAKAPVSQATEELVWPKPPVVAADDLAHHRGDEHRLDRPVGRRDRRAGEHQRPLSDVAEDLHQ